MKAKLMALFLGWQGLVAIVGVGFASLWGVYAFVEHKGVKKERARVEKATTNAINLGSGAASKSGQPRTPGVRPVGQRDPTTRHD